MDPTGQLSIWYSHKKADDSGFCVEQSPQLQRTQPVQLKAVDEWNGTSQKMYACNAMNNAVALACNGKIPVEQIGSHFKKILTDLAAIS